MKTFQFAWLIFSIILPFYTLTLWFKTEKLQKELDQKPVIELPEEYKAITIDDNLYGTYSNDTLRIFFNNGPNQ